MIEVVYTLVDSLATHPVYEGVIAALILKVALK
jgi:hypothetical protein